MDGVKHWYASKTVWGAAIVALGLLLDMTSAEQTMLSESAASLAAQITEIVGVIITIYGRSKAKNKLGK